MKQELPVMIIGGGVAGVMAARTLIENGIDHVQIIEKSRSVGGRLATRRMTNGKVDHGAQFFTVRTEKLQQHTKGWLQQGIVKPWFGEVYKRYTAVSGMNALVKQLAQDLHMRTNTRVAAITEQDNHLHMVTEDDEAIQARGVIVTAPAPQAYELLQQTNSPALATLAGIQFFPCLVALLTLNSETNLPASGHVAEGLPADVERIVDHQKKGISEAVTVSVYMKGQWARAHYEQDDETILEEILAQCSPFFDCDAIIEKQLKRWRYAEAETFVQQPFLDAALQAPLLIAGDAFLHEADTAGRTRFESAFLSGIAAGEEMVKRLKS